MVKSRVSQRSISDKKWPDDYPPMSTVRELLQQGIATGVDYPQELATVQQRIAAIDTDEETVTSLLTQETITLFENTASGVVLRQTDIVATTMKTVALKNAACLRYQDTVPSIDAHCATQQTVVLSSDPENIRAATASSNGETIVINQAPPLPKVDRCQLEQTDLSSLLFSTPYPETTTPSILTLLESQTSTYGTTTLSDVAVNTITAPSDTIQSGQVELPVEIPFIIGKGDRALIFKPVNTITQATPLIFMNRFYVYQQRDLQPSSQQQNPLFIIESFEQFIFQGLLLDVFDEFGNVTHRDLILARKNCFKGEIIKISNVDQYQNGYVIDLSSKNLQSQGIYTLYGAAFSDLLTDPKYQHHSMDLLTEVIKDDNGRLRQWSYLVVGTLYDPQDNRVRIIDLNTVTSDFELNMKNSDEAMPTILQIQSSLPVINGDEYNEFGYAVAVMGETLFKNIHSRYIAISNPKANELFILSPQRIHDLMQRYQRQIHTVASKTLWIAGIQDDVRKEKAWCQALGEKIFVSQDRRFLGMDCPLNRQVIVDTQQWFNRGNITRREVDDDSEIQQDGVRVLQQRQNEQINMAAGLMLLLPNITAMGVSLTSFAVDAINSTLERAVTMSQNITTVDCGYHEPSSVEENHWPTANMLAFGAGIVMLTSIACLGFFRQRRLSSARTSDNNSSPVVSL